MSEYTRVIFSSMEQGEADFRQTYSALVNEVSTLESQLQGSLSEWIGSAQQAYHEAQAQWNAAMADMQQVLAALAAVIGTANSNYQSAEAANTGLWG
jgi:early secretory antigenic target protein ESAT-6